MDSPYRTPLAVDGPTGSYESAQREIDNFDQAGRLFRLQDGAAQNRLIANIANELAKVTISGVVERSVSYFERSDADLGRRLRGAIEDLRSLQIVQVVQVVHA